jgi:hypothetical protein
MLSTFLFIFKFSLVSILSHSRKRCQVSHARRLSHLVLHLLQITSANTHPSLYNVSALQNPASPLIIYLPPTGIHLRSSHSPVPRYLFHPLASLASIHYRWNIPPSPSSPTSLDDSISQYITPPPSPKLLSSDPSFAIYPFPTPLHDVLHAYSYLLQNLLPQYSETPPSSSSPTSSLTGTRRTLYSTTSTTKIIQRPILIYGSYLGGTLATSLGLTESFASKNLPTRIAGLISKNGIYDWTDIATTPPSLPNPLTLTDTLSQPESEYLKKGIWDSKILYTLREKLFREPGGAFDPFASPSLFFRTAGIAVPKTWPLSSDDNPTTTPAPPSPAAPPNTTSTSSSPLINHLEEDIFYPTPDPSLVTDIDVNEFGARRGRDGGELELEVSRKAHLKYPPKDSGLKIPRSLFLYSAAPTSTSTSPSSTSPSVAAKEGEDITPKTQAEEITKLMRRSLMLHEFKDRRMWDEDLDPSAAVEERVQLSPIPTFAVSHEEEVEARTVVEWLNETVDMSDTVR